MADTPLFLPVLMMVLVAPIGGFDVAWYHIYRFRLYRQPGSRAETVTHLIRSLLFATGLLLMVLWRPSGAWFWAIGGLFVLDFVNNIADVLLEPASRRPLGGLPPMEYLIHVIGATASGAITTAYFLTGWSLGGEPTALVSVAPDAFPDLVRWQAFVVVAGGGLLTMIEGALLVRGWVHRARDASC